jgi:hypothetical protein
MNPSSRLPSLLTVALALFTLAGCAATPPPATSLPADAWIPPGSVEMSFASREARPAHLANHEMLVTGLRANAPAGRRNLLRGVR